MIDFSILILKLPRPIKKIIVLCVDFFIMLGSTWLAFFFRFEESVGISQPMLLAGVVSTIVGLPVFFLQGFYSVIYRFNSWFVTSVLIRTLLIYTSLYFFIITFIGIEGVPRSVGLIQPILLFIFIGLSRIIAIALLNFSFVGKRSCGDKSVALIYGAGSAGRQLASGLRQSNGIKPVAFIDDNPEYWKSTINGLPVYGPDDIPSLLSSSIGITDILLAMPSAGHSRQQALLAKLSNLSVHIRVLPGLSHLANGIVKIEDIREVEIDDILGREPVQASEELLYQNIAGKIVFVSGAGGSIGSELCRQILIHKPDTLVLFELNEFALYLIERELNQSGSLVKIIPILGSVLDSNKLARVFRRFRVQTVYHAAAYKHVPMIEMNPSSGVWNNVFGTLRIVDSARESGVETLVLVSTDKAVRPTNVMGCSKRLAELILQAKSMQESKLDNVGVKLTMVRFGNVLGSSGSVVPVFREQIKSGGPVTVTHPEIIRYFMTIPEAAQLVIQAGAIGHGGDVMVLDMGEPVKIIELAKRMIHLSGFSCKDEENPEGDIEIQFTGLRQGEKLFEELLIGENTLPTPHPRIMRAIEHSLSWVELEDLLLELEAAIKADDSDIIRSLLRRAVPEFNPQSDNGDLLK
jgi:FlaA1/EpsC-like NDP-sugar epimerase